MDGSTTNDDGFTLIELLVVIIIIGILAAIAIPIFLNQRKKGYNAAAKSDMRNLASLEEAYRTEHNEYTTDLATLAAGGAELARSANVRVAIRVADDGESFCLAAYSTKTVPTPPPVVNSPPTGVFVYDSVGGGSAAASCSLSTGSWTGWL
ncbi:MAG: prepilin-type N-terminal cleavage/methylation domain-containing protein [Frankia sp.]|nr:prepilin-type N-terminal cleavage/methylation domain-containing protein [Frankia sp.]